MGKASRRKRRQRADGHRDRARAAASAPAPNFGAAAVEAARYAIAMVTAAHASPEDLNTSSGSSATSTGPLWRFVAAGLRIASCMGSLPS